MNRSIASVTRRFTWSWLVPLACVGIALIWSTSSTAPARADGGNSTVVAVEEDWELVVGEPDADSLAPQVTVVISPVANPDLLYAALDINHHSQFEFSSGGLQLQVWGNDEAMATAESNSNCKLSSNNETITWTQHMDVNQGDLTFSILNGQSDTWGAFGGNGELSLTVGTSLNDLSGYSPDVSVHNTGIGFASNRVKSLTLKKVRTITAGGDVSEDSTARSVFQRD